MGAAGEAPTMGVVVEPRADAHSTSRLARWFPVGTRAGVALGGVVRPGRKVRFAQLIHRPARVLGGPAVRAALGGNLKHALVATPSGAARYRPSQPLDSARYPPRELRPAQAALLARTELVT